ncbi:MAG: efflux RND transporter periplasmic adaptor subunit, partial [Rikenellaceae bacterium]
STLLKRDSVSQEALEQVQTALATLQADIDIIDAKIALTKLYAPFDGTIGLRQVSLGSYATPTTVVAKLTKMSPLKIEFSVPERYAQTIDVGTKLEFRVEGELETFKASVYATESTVDPELHQYTVRAIYPNSRGQLMPGRYAAVTLHKEEISDALAVPSESIVPEMGKDKVYLYRSGKATPVEIVTGLRTESQVQVVKGLNVGDTLVVSGTLQLRMGLDITLDQVD